MLDELTKMQQLTSLT